MNLFKLLSYPLNKKTILYGSTPKIRFIKDLSIKNGDACNTTIIRLSTHSGTHIDVPHHFIQKGKKVQDYPFIFEFNNPVILDIPKKESEVVRKNDIKNIHKKCDILFIKTGFHKFRNLIKYKLFNPGLSPECATFIRENFKNLKAIGIDTISFSSFQHRQEGRKTHNILLSNNFSSKPLILFEDVNLKDCKKFKKIIAIPYFYDKIDGSPVILIGFK